MFAVWALRLAFLLLCGALSTAALMPPGADDASVPWLPNDKILHVVAYSVLSFSALLAFPRVTAWWVAAALGLHGLAIELVQPVVSRVSELGDMVANMVGILIGFASIYACRLRPIMRRQLRARDPNSVQ